MLKYRIRIWIYRIKRLFLKEDREVQNFIYDNDEDK